MFNHTVIFWTDPSVPGAAEELLALMEPLRAVPGVTHLGCGKCYQPEDGREQKATVDQSYQVALHVQFESAAAHDAYQVHPLHLPVVAAVKRLCFWDGKLHVKAFDFV